LTVTINNNNCCFFLHEKVLHVHLNDSRRNYLSEK
jgi:hypothetical protein